MAKRRSILHGAWVLWLLCTFLAVGCATVQNQNRASKENREKFKEGREKRNKIVKYEPEKAMKFTEKNQITEKYRIGLDDLLDVSVFGEPGLSKIQRVRPDGKIALPMIGDVMAYGKTPLELRDIITERMEKYILKPKVTVLVAEYRSKKMTILGEVRAPGLLRFSSNISILEAISLAGGVTDAADLRGSMVIRNEKIVPVSFYRLLKKGDLRHNIVLKPNDAIFLASNKEKKVYVVGQVRKPGILRISDTLTVFEAITAAGGVSVRGKSKAILISGGIGDPQLIEVDLEKIVKKGDMSEDVYLESGDIVYVPENFISKMNLVLATVTNILSPLVLLESGIGLYPTTRSVIKSGRLPETKSTTLPSGETTTTTIE